LWATPYVPWAVVSEVGTQDRMYARWLPLDSPLVNSHMEIRPLSDKSVPWRMVAATDLQPHPIKVEMKAAGFYINPDGGNNYGHFGRVKACNVVSRTVTLNVPNQGGKELVNIPFDHCVAAYSPTKKDV
jgi:hypothetical protein